jgi:hypothetical protein
LFLVSSFQTILCWILTFLYEGTSSLKSGRRREGRQILMRCKKIGWAATWVAQNAAESSPAMVLKLRLSGLATGVRREVDDLAPQIFRSPLLLGVEVCRNIEPDQFRHDVLLAGNPTPFRDVPAEPMPESGPVKVHVSLFSNSCYALVAS